MHYQDTNVKKKKDTLNQPTENIILSPLSYYKQMKSTEAWD